VFVSGSTLAAASALALSNKVRTFEHALAFVLANTVKTPGGE